MKSASGSLNPSGWDGINNGDADWTPLALGDNPGSEFMEAHFAGKTTFANGMAPIDLGDAFDIGGTEDLEVWVQIGNTNEGAFLELPSENITYVISSGNPTGDYNNDGTVDAADYTVWRDNLNASITLPNEDPGAATPGVVDAEDYAFWKANFGASAGAVSATGAAVPEPSSIVMLLFGMIALAVRWRR